MKYISVLLLITLLASCTGSNEVVITNTNTGENINVENNISTDSTESVEGSEYKEREVELNLKNSETLKITLDSENTEINSESLQLSGQVLTIKKSGNYEFTGILDNGQIIVETDDEKDVQIILNNVSIENDFGPAILVNNAEQTVINLADNSTNTLSDGDDYSLEEDDGSGAGIFSKDDLIINGNGTLEVNGNFQDGIVSKDKLFIDSGNITVNAIDDGIRGKDYLLINNANIDISSDSDGLKSNNEEKATIVINSGTINISAGDDAVHSEIYLVINGGTINVSKSYEGLEAKYITFNGGDINIVSSDDGINATAGSTTGGSNNTQQGGERPERTMNNSGGTDMGQMGERPERTMNNSGDTDGDQMMSIMNKQRNGEELTEDEESLLSERESNKPDREEEGLFTEMKESMGEMFSGGKGGGGGGDSDDGSIVYFNGGNIVLNSNGDGFDSNGKIIMTGGKITIFGPENSGNGSIDYNGSFEITGGEVIAIGSSGMVQTPAESEEVNTINIGLTNNYGAGETIVIKDSSGEELYNIDSIKKFQNIVISSNKLITGNTYTLEISGSIIEEITITDKITKAGSFNSRGGRN